MTVPTSPSALAQFMAFMGYSRRPSVDALVAQCDIDRSEAERLMEIAEKREEDRENHDAHKSASAIRAEHDLTESTHD